MVAPCIFRHVKKLSKIKLKLFPQHVMQGKKSDICNLIDYTIIALLIFTFLVYAIFSTSVQK